ncbi:hypothetical protein [Halalkalibacter krulwichiae]|uniref:Uncharacterized protein n=1 Tax=Halalkalibacter krulwichiae TaxID=199441 RepID=A0A1X9MGL5_9BACI|nr:hypothetical protein [Halalkalibacter krulwichiae]ARK32619.1 hypothetical protein BkAM31D_23610 [Halalkalibacter krulwichiae]
MWKDFKNKRYWLLMPPFIVIGLLLIMYLPQTYKQFVALVGIPLFWILYALWNKKREGTTSVKKE